MSHYNLDAMAFNAEKAAVAISDPSALPSAFMFDRTPQGKEFWEAQTTEPTAEGLAILQFMLAASIELTAINTQHMQKAAA